MCKIYLEIMAVYKKCTCNGHLKYFCHVKMQPKSSLWVKMSRTDMQKQQSPSQNCLTYLPNVVVQSIQFIYWSITIPKCCPSPQTLLTWSSLALPHIYTCTFFCSHWYHKTIPPYYLAANNQESSLDGAWAHSLLIRSQTLWHCATRDVL